MQYKETQHGKLLTN